MHKNKVFFAFMKNLFQNNFVQSKNTCLYIFTSEFAQAYEHLLFTSSSKSQMNQITTKQNFLGEKTQEI